MYDSFLSFLSGDTCGGGISAISSIGAILALMGILSLGVALFPVFIFGVIIAGATGVVKDKLCS